jgi:hypothetical protein
MKFKFVQTRLVRYTVVIEAPDADVAYDKVFQHEEWNEDGVEEEDPPWSEKCPEDAIPDLYVVGGHVLLPSDYLDPIKSVPDRDGKPVVVGARVKYQRGTFKGARWFPGTVTFLHSASDGSYALVEDDEKDIKHLKHGTWVGSSRIALLTEEDEKPKPTTITIFRHADDIEIDLVQGPMGWHIVATRDEYGDEVELTDEEIVRARSLADSATNTEGS